MADTESSSSKSMALARKSFSAASAHMDKHVAATSSNDAHKYVTWVWMTIAFVVLILFIIGCAAADKNEGDNGGVAFAAVWTVLISIGLTILGTVIMRKYRTALSMGIFLGLTTILANQCFVVMVIYGSKASDEEDDSNDSDYSADAAFAFFSCCLWILYMCFSLLMFMFRDYLIKEDFLKPEAVDLPPELNNVPSNP